MTELHQCTATKLAAMIRTGETSSRDVVAAHLARIEAVNGTTNAVTAVLSDAAAAAAERADRMRRSGQSLPPLHGVPFTVKEMIVPIDPATSGAQPVARGRASC
jgi:amidase